MKILLALVLFAGIYGCNGSDNSGTATEATDTTQQPGGTVNSNVISTDTAAINMQNSVDKAELAASTKTISLLALHL